MKKNLKKIFYSGMVAFAMFFALALGLLAMPRPQEVVKATTNLWATPRQVYINDTDGSKHFRDNDLYWTATGGFSSETTRPDAEYDPTNGVLKVYMYGNTVQNSINSISVKGGDAAVDLVIQFEYDEGDYGFSWASINFNGSITNQTGGNLTFVVGDYIEDNENFGQAQVLGGIGTTGDIVIGEKMNFSICPQPADEYAIKARNLTISGTSMEIDTTGSNVDGVAAFDLSGNLTLTDVNLFANVDDQQFIHFANANCRANVSNSEIAAEAESVEKFANYDANFYKYADKCKYDVLEDANSFMLMLEPMDAGELTSIQVSYNPGEGTGTAQAYETVAYETPITALRDTDEDYALLDFAAPAGKRLVRWAVNDENPRDGLCVEQGGTFVVRYKTELIALWEYIVVFESCGGTGNCALELGAVLDSENVITLPANPYTYEGKRFMGWAVGNPDADPQNPGAEVEITGETTIYAKWEDEYAVSYNANADGATGEMNGAMVLKNGTFTLGSCGFSVEGKRFVGWGVNNNAPETADLKQPGAQITITETTTIYAIWMNVYSVAYNANLDNYTGEMAGANVDEGTIFELETCAFSAAGKRFVGWGVNNNAPEAADLKQSGDTFAVTSHTIVYAIWMDVYQIHYDSTSGSGDAVAYGEYPSGTLITLKTAEECGFTAPENYEFGGWMIGTTTYDAGDEYTITEETYVHAVWNRTLFIITFDAGEGGIGTMDDVTKTKNESYTLPANGFEPNGRKHFVGWSVGGQTKAPGTEITITADTEITALWVTWFEVFFDANGATGIMDNAQVDEGTKLVLPTPTFTPAEGTRFKDWVLDGEHYAVGAEVDITADNKHISAYWIDEVVEEVVDTDDAKQGFDVSEIFAEAKANHQTLKFVVDGMVLEFDENAVQSIGGQTTSLSVDVSTNVAKTKVKGAQKLINLSLSNDVFADGTAQGLVRVVVPVDELKAKGKEVKVYYLSPDGDKIDVEAVYENGQATFVTNHFSQYVLAFEGSEPAKLSVWQIILIILAASVVCGFVGIAIFFGLKKKK